MPDAAAASRCWDPPSTVDTAEDTFRLARVDAELRIEIDEAIRHAMAALFADLRSRLLQQLPFDRIRGFQRILTQ